MKPFLEEEKFTRFHNYLFDKVMPVVKPAAWKVLCCIVRSTAGWQMKDGTRKITDKISYRQLLEKTGIKNRTTIRDAVAELISLDLITFTAGGVSESNEYGLNWEYEAPSTEIVLATQPSTEIVPEPSTEIGIPPSTKIVNTKERTTKEKEKTVSSTNGKARDPLFDVIANNWHTAPGQTSLLKSLMLGTNKRYADCNFSPPAAPDEVAAFVEWYRRKYPKINLPVAPEKLQSHFYAFRKSPNTSKRPETRWNPTTRTNEEKVGDTWYTVTPQRPA